jgi:pimeloyl-ACP methyl ester carboxylesterase
MRLLLPLLVAASACRGREDDDPDARVSTQEIDVSIPASAGITLAGTLARPVSAGGARVPVVVLIGGSGPQDRDGTRPELAGYRPFRDLAGSLGAVGIATLRLDDRGTGGSSGRFSGATTLDFAADVEAALRWLRARDDVDGAHPALLGHSEGALVALLAASRDSSVSALVLLGAPSRSGRELARWQRAALVASDRAEFAPSDRDELLSRAESEAERAAADDPWLRVWFSLDPRSIARSTRAPALLLHGLNDRQVPVEQAAELAAALSERRSSESERGPAGAPEVELRRFPATDHLFLRDYDGEPRGYVRLVSRRLRTDVSEAIGSWLRARFRALDTRCTHVANRVALSSQHVRVHAPEEKSCVSE